MAHHKSALKRIQIAERNRLRNRDYRTSVKSSIKEVLSTTSKEDAQKKYNETASLLDKMVIKGIIHKNRAANKKARLIKHVNSLT